MKSRTSKTFPGINIQYPISQKILSGSKTIETRTYPIPEKYVNVPLLIIETPGDADFKARLVGAVIFDSCFKYRSAEHFYADAERHKVQTDSPWAWSEKPKWGWKISDVYKFKSATPLSTPKGIRFTTSVPLPPTLRRELDRFLESE